MTSPALASDDRLLVALPEAARLVSLSQATIRRMCADGRMPPLVKIGSRSLVQVDALRRVAQLGPGLGADQTGVLQSQQSQ